MSSVLPIAMSGMNPAMQRLQTSAASIASGSDGAQEAVDLMTARVGFEANVSVARIAAQMFDRLLDIKV